MTPVLAERGRYIVVTSILFILVGVLHDDAWPLVALGVVVATAVMAAGIWFYPTAIMLRRRKIELAWWVPAGELKGGALTVDQPFPLHVALRNHGPVALRVLAVDVLGPGALDLPPKLEALVPAGQEVMLISPVKPKAVGHWVLHGAHIVLGDLLGLFEVRAYFPNPLALKVFPQLAATRAEVALPRPQVGAPDERGGRHRVRQRGLAGALRELREHQFGDPFKMIAWKATARKQRLMVRDLDNEIVMSHQILLDVGASMRSGPVGKSGLDAGIALAAQLARQNLEAGDRVGLTTYDHRVLGRLRPGEGRPHLLHLCDRLIDARQPDDEDTIDLTDGELVALVARYLLHQEALDVRLRVAPRVDDPRWAKIAAGPDGALYDMAAIVQVTGTLLEAAQKAARGRAATAPVTVESDLARLRTFCRVRGIELPYRPEPPPARAEGLAAALSMGSARERANVVIVISDLGGLVEQPTTLGALHAPMARARSRGQRVVILMPATAHAQAATPMGKRVAHLAALSERRRASAARTLLAPLGFEVRLAGSDAELAGLRPGRLLELVG